MAMSGQFYLCLLRHFHSSSHPLAPAAIHNNPTSTESFPFSPGSHFFLHCSSHIFGRLQAVVSCHVLSRFGLTYRGKLAIRLLRGCFLRHSTRRLCVVKSSSPAYLRRYVARRPSFAAAAFELTPPALSLSPCWWCPVTRFLDLSVTVHGSGLLHHCSGGSKAGGPEGVEAEGAGRLPLSAAQQQRSERRRLDSSQPSAAVQPDCWWALSCQSSSRTSADRDTLPPACSDAPTCTF